MSLTYFPEPMSLSAVAAAKAAPTVQRLREFGMMFAGMVQRARLEFDYRRAARDLRMLNARMLDDIGLDRSEIDHVVRCGR